MAIEYPPPDPPSGLSPTQKARIEPFINGPDPGEDRNVWLARCNKVLTDADREWIVQFMDYFNYTHPEKKSGA